MRYLIVMGFLLLPLLSFAQEPENLSIVKQGLVKYHDSGEYMRDIAAAEAPAIAYLQTRINQNKTQHKKLALVLDIDETSLSNYDSMKSFDFGGNEQVFKQQAASSTATVIDPTLKLYQFAETNGITVFFITGRYETYRANTLANLEKVGYKQPFTLHMKPNSYPFVAFVAPYKTAVRKQIAAQGYDIVLNVGDQESDLKGGYADKTIKLPNPYYIIP